MRKGEARELAGMLTTLAVLMAIGLGVSSVAPELPETAEAPVPAETPAVVAPIEGDEFEAPLLLGPAERLPALLRIYEVIDSADPASRLPVGVAVGV